MIWFSAQALRVPEPQVQSTVTELIKCSQTNISGDTDHLSTWRPPHTTVIWYSAKMEVPLDLNTNSCAWDAKKQAISKKIYFHVSTGYSWDLNATTHLSAFWYICTSVRIANHSFTDRYNNCKMVITIVKRCIQMKSINILRLRKIRSRIKTFCTRNGAFSCRVLLHLEYFNASFLWLLCK